MSIEKQTAVEWLINKHFGGVNNCTPDFRYHIEQAKEMERKQIQLAYATRCSFIECNVKSKEQDAICECGSKYYEITFNQ